MTNPLHDDPRTALAAWVAAFNSHDIDRIGALYAEEAVLWGTFSADLIASRQGIRAYFERAFAQAMSAAVELDAVRIQTVGTVAICSGVYLLQAFLAGQQRVLEARFTVVLRPESGGWSIINHHSSLRPVLPDSGAKPDLAMA